MGIIIAIGLVAGLLLGIWLIVSFPGHENRP